MKVEPTEEEKNALKRTYKKYGIGAAVLIVLVSAGVLAMNQGDLSSNVAKQQPVEKKIGKEGTTRKNKPKKRNTDPFEQAVGLIQEGANYVFGIDKDGKNLFNDTKGLLNPLTALAEEERSVKKEETKSIPPVVVPDGPISGGLGPVIPTKPIPPTLPPISPPTVSYPTIVAEDVVIGIHSDFNPSDYASATDSLDGSLDSELQWDVSGLDTSTSGHYVVRYSVTNSHQLTTTKAITVIVNENPVIHLSKTWVVLPVRSEFNARDYVTATDAEGGDLTSSVMIASTVDTQKAGVYKVTFSVSDKYGFSTIKEMVVVMTNQKPVIHAEDSAIQIDKPFDPLLGVTASDKESGDITEDLQLLENNVDVTKAGVYTVTYFVADGNGGETTKVRTITVVNEPPVIHAKELEFALNSPALTKEKALEGVTVTDREDDENGKPIDILVDESQLAAIDMTVAGKYDLTYSATDSHGLTTTKTIYVVVTNEAPEIFGAEDIQIEEGTEFDPLEGVTATDKEDGPIELTLDNVTGSVDPTTAGVYELIYTVTDSDGNVAQKTRIVMVIQKEEQGVK